MPRVTIDLTDDEAAQLATLGGQQDQSAQAAELFRLGLLLKSQTQRALSEQENDERIFGPDEPWSDGYLNYSTGKIEPGRAPD